MSRKKSLCLGLSAILLAGCASGGRRPPAVDPDSLYARLGELNGVARATDAMVNHVLSDPVILENKQLQQRAKPENVPGLKVQITVLIASRSGGPYQYTGQSMKEAHRGMEVTEAQWAAFMKDCADGLDEAKVPARERQGVLDLFASMKADIVERE
ncbi:MAG: group 1 truncated hemoglobin [Planctomycetes bacterium]|nr:group 1 truncated hemoglobin [Planctomycetota bacterium]